MAEDKTKDECKEEKQLLEELNEETNIPEGFSDVIENIPPEHRKQVKQMMISAVQMRGMANPESAVSKKITEAHISEYLAGSREDMQRGYQEKRDRKIFNFFITVLGIAFIIAIIILLKDNPEMLEKILYASGGIVAGAFGGYGYGKTREE